MDSDKKVAYRLTPSSVLRALEATGRKEILVQGCNETDRTALCQALRSEITDNSDITITEGFPAGRTLTNQVLVARTEADPVTIPLLVDLDNPFGKAACAVMASGLGTRFTQASGSADNKLLLKLNDKYVVQYAIEKALLLFTSSVLVTRNLSVHYLAQSLGIRSLMHELPYKNDSTRLATEALLTSDHIMFLQGDQPAVSSDTLAALLLTARNCPDKIIRLSYKSQDSAPVVFPASCYEALMKLPEDKGGSYLIKTGAADLVRVEAENMNETIDIDRPDDLYLLSEGQGFTRPHISPII